MAKAKPVRMTLTPHMQKVARAIIAQIYGISTKRIRCVCDDYLWATVDYNPRFNAEEAQRFGWVEIPMGRNSVVLSHKDWPEARLEVCFNEYPAGRDTQVAIYREVTQ